MGKEINLDIVLENTEAVFAPLDVVRGQVVVELAKATKVKDIKLRFRGQANVKWQEEEGTGIGITRMNNSRFFRGQEQFFDTAVTLVSRADNDHKEIVMEPNTYTFPFAFRLKEGLPTSFEASHGHIRYWLYSSVGIPKTLSKKRRKPITVLNRVDLNNFEEITCSRTDEIEKSFGTACFHSAPMNAIIRLSKMGYVPGEALHVDAEVRNRSDVAIRYTRCVLTQIIKYHSCGRTNSTKVASVPVATVTREQGIGSGQSAKWREERLRVPPIPPTSYKECKIIELHYRLIFEMKPSRFKSKIKLSLPVVIGTIPIEGFFVTYQPPPSNPAETGLLSRAAATPFLTPLCSIGIPAPSYFESIFGKVQMQTTTESDSDEEPEDKTAVEFVPFYTFYGTHQ